MTGSFAEFEAAIGRKTVTEDLITSTQLQKMAMALGRRDPIPQHGDPLPTHWHPAFFRRLAHADDMLRDGAPVDMDERPDPPYPIRMYAGGKLTYHQPLRVGQAARCEREIASITPKEGRSGKMAFAIFRNCYFGPDGLAFEEEQTIVFREEDKSDGPKKLPEGPDGPVDAPWKRTHDINEIRLFQFSAATFNTHRIHYDLPYVKEVEGYPALLIHGPFIATLMADLARDSQPDRDIKIFEYRAKAPLWVNQPVTVLGAPSGDGGTAEMWATSAAGKVGMEATVTYD